MGTTSTSLCFRVATSLTLVVYSMHLVVVSTLCIFVCHHLRHLFHLSHPYVRPSDFANAKREEAKPLVNAFMRHHLRPDAANAIRLEGADVFSEAETLKQLVNNKAVPISAAHRDTLSTVFLRPHRLEAPVRQEAQGHSQLLADLCVYLAVVAGYAGAYICCCSVLTPQIVRRTPWQHEQAQP